jgi:hypothetical protein
MGAQSGSIRPSSRFNTVETQFFKEGEELSTPPPVENDWDEAIDVPARHRSKHGIAKWVALGAVVLVVFAVLIF